MSTNIVPRVVAVAAVALAAVAVLALVLVRGGEPYTVKARFVTASQLVKGNLVQVSGAPAGQVDDIRLTDNGQAEVTMTIDEKYAPLRRGTQAIVRQSSLSGVANRYVDLQMGGGTSADLPVNALIPTTQTESSVDLDQLFNVLGPRERASVRNVIVGFAETYAGRADKANRALRYLNPAVASSSRLFAELNRDTPELRRFIDESSRLFSDVAERRTDVSGLVDHLAQVNTTLAAERGDVTRSIRELPAFMRKANTTFVNLRSTLDDVDPLVAESRPVVRKLRPLFAELRPFAAEAAPTVRDLSTTIRQPGDDNDLIELLGVQPPLDEIANGPVEDNGQKRDGAFAESRDALNDATPELAFARPYAPELTGWFDDFSHSGAYDALGGFSRAGLGLSALTVNPLFGVPAGDILPPPLAALLPADLRTVLAQQRRALFEAQTETGYDNRCPGSVERSFDGSNPFLPGPGDFECDPDQRPIGP